LQTTIEAFIRQRLHWIVVFADESDDPRPSEQYQVAINLMLIPKDVGDQSVQAFHLDLVFPDEVNNVTMSDAIDSVLRVYHVNCEDLRLFVHDSAPYMNPSAERLKSDKGYMNLVHLPCWPHLISLVPGAVFDSGILVEITELTRLVALLFARSPFWRTKWVAWQEKEMAKWKADNDLFTDETLKKRHELEKPGAVKSPVRGSTVRWASQHDALMYWRCRCRAFKRFLTDRDHGAADLPPSGQAILKLLDNDDTAAAIAVQFRFCNTYLTPLYTKIMAFQNASGGPDGQKVLDDFKVVLKAIASGTFDEQIDKWLAKYAARTSARVARQMSAAASCMLEKIASLQLKTIKDHKYTEDALKCFGPELLQTRAMLNYTDMSRKVPGLPRGEWEKYVVMAAPQPRPCTNTARRAWWEDKKEMFPALATIAVFFIRRPRSACQEEAATPPFLLVSERNNWRPPHKHELVFWQLPGLSEHSV